MQVKETSYETFVNIETHDYTIVEFLPMGHLNPIRNREKLVDELLTFGRSCCDLKQAFPSLTKIEISDDFDLKSIFTVEFQLEQLKHSKRLIVNGYQNGKRLLKIRYGIHA